MDRLYLVWLAVLGVGFLLGLFLRARLLGTLVVVVMGGCIVGLVIAAALKAETATWVFGLSLMAAPVLGGILFAGAALANSVKRKRHQEKEDE